MQIQCKKCNFTVDSQGENFYYEPKDINFCMNCGANYLQSGTDVVKLAKAHEVSNKLFSKMFGYAGGSTIAYLLGWNVHKLNNISKNIDKLDKFKDATIKEIHDLKLNCIKNHK